MSSKTKKVIGIGLILFLGILLSFSLLSFPVLDTSPYIDTALRPEQIEHIPIAENGYYPFKKAFGSVNLSHAEEVVLKKILSQQTAYSPDIAANILKKNKDSIYLFGQSQQSKIFVFPPLSIKAKSQDLTETYNLLKISKLIYLKRLQILQLYYEGKKDSAIQEALKLLAFSKNMQGDNLLFIGINEGIYRDILSDLIFLLKGTHFKGIKNSSLINQLEILKLPPNSLVTALKHEYARNWSLINITLSDVTGMPLETEKGSSFTIPTHPGIPYFYQKNKTHKLLANYYQALILNAQKPYWKSNHNPIPNPAFSLSEFTYKIGPNCFGYNTLALLPTYGDLSFSRSYANTRISMIQLLVALKLYEAKQGHLPTSLNELIPNYFDTIPIDLLTGKSIHYSAKKKELYNDSSKRIVIQL